MRADEILSTAMLNLLEAKRYETVPVKDSQRYLVGVMWSCRKVWMREEVKKKRETPDIPEGGWRPESGLLQHLKACMKPSDWEMLRLHYGEELSTRLIAQRLRTTRGVVRYRLRLALKNARDYCQEE